MYQGTLLVYISKTTGKTWSLLHHKCEVLLMPSCCMPAKPDTYWLQVGPPVLASLHCLVIHPDVGSMLCPGFHPMPQKHFDPLPGVLVQIMADPEQCVQISLGAVDVAASTLSLLHMVLELM